MIFAYETAENEMFITFQEENISSDSFKILKNNKKSNSCLDRVNSCTSTPRSNPIVEERKERFHNACIFLIHSCMRYNH